MLISLPSLLLKNHERRFDSNISNFQRELHFSESLMGTFHIALSFSFFFFFQLCHLLPQQCNDAQKPEITLKLATAPKLRDGGKSRERKAELSILAAL